ncbi:ATP-dependent DNA helicase PIF1, partial [Trifolium medium]|nr:ATP-dependent DNA helicase PIF1 [Trifolium medium]
NIGTETEWKNMNLETETGTEMSSEEGTQLAFERTMRDVMSPIDPQAKTKPFGGTTVVLGGDFRQILPVVRKGNRQDILSATVNSSNLWSYCCVLRLTKKYEALVKMVNMTYIFLKTCLFKTALIP